MSPSRLKIIPSELRIDSKLGTQPFDWQDWFGRTGPVEVEIGIGKGRFLLEAASRRPEVLHLGVEWANEYLNLVLKRAETRALKNIRLIRIDATLLVAQAIPNDSVDAYYVFYPDPWPKRRHQKRRFLQAKNARHLIRTLKVGGHLHVATDHPDYWEWIETHFAPLKALEPLLTFGGSHFPVEIEKPLTNYEAKYEREGRARFRKSWRLVSKQGAAELQDSTKR